MWSTLIFSQIFIFVSSQTVTLQWCQQNVFEKFSNLSAHGPEIETCLDFLKEEDENTEKETPSHSTATPGSFPNNPKCDRRSAFIFLTGLGRKYQTACEIFAKSLGLHLTENVIRCPAPPERKTDILKHLPDVVQDFLFPNAWFNLSCMPAKSIFGSKKCESKQHLDESLMWIEHEIESLMREGVCSENIVLSGISQVYYDGYEKLLYYFILLGWCDDNLGSSTYKIQIRWIFTHGYLGPP